MLRVDFIYFLFIYLFSSFCLFWCAWWLLANVWDSVGLCDRLGISTFYDDVLEDGYILAGLSWIGPLACNMRTGL